VSAVRLAQFVSVPRGRMSYFEGVFKLTSAAHERSHTLPRPPIVLTTSDRDSLLSLLRSESTTIEPSIARFLREELERADIAPNEISSNAIVSIGSRVKFVNHNSTSIREVKLVLPDEGNDVDLVSVTGALGSALLGLGPGQTISWYEGQTERRTGVLETSTR
jgi:regulator of nucleoside diphosphate kinase